MHLARRHGFTLIELLVVIAITSILLGLLLIPLVQGFRFTRQGQIQAQVQDTVRLALNQITNDIRRAAYVYDTSRRSVAIYVSNPAGNPVRFDLQGAIIDLVPPAYGDPSQPSNDPTSEIPIGPRGEPNAELAVPVAPGRTVVRYFIGLADNTSQNGVPVNPHLNPDTAGLVSATQRDNLAVLYRAEFPLFVRVGNQWQLNPELFDRPEDFYDPNFFYGPKWQGWRKVAKPVMLVGEVDMINVTYNDQGVPVSVEPLFQLRPAQVVNQTGNPVENLGVSDETRSQVAVLFTFPHGLWELNSNTFRLEMYPAGTGQVLPQGFFRFIYEPSLQEWRLLWIEQETNQRPWIFNETIAQGMLQTGARDPQWWNYSIVPRATYYVTRPEERIPPMAFLLKHEAGMIDMAIPWWFDYAPFPPEGIVFNTGRFLTPFTQQTDYRATVNEVFNLRYNQTAPEQRNNVKRYISLLDLDYDFDITDPESGVHLRLGYARIVPGSEVIIGPDQRPGPNYGNPVRYERVPWDAPTVGLNQYKILYEDVAPIDEVYANFGFVPSLLRGYIEFQSDPNLPLPPDSSIFIRFHYQFNTPGDVFAMDYQTRRLMELRVGVRAFGPERPINFSLGTQLELPNLVQLRYPNSEVR